MRTYDNTAHAYITAWNARDATERKEAVAAAFARTPPTSTRSPTCPAGTRSPS